MKKNEKMWIGAGALIALAIPALVTLGAAQPKRHFIPSGSMEPTLAIGSTIRVKRQAYTNIAQVQRGDIIVATRRNSASGATEKIVQRVVGLPNDKVRISGSIVSINGHPLRRTVVRRAGNVTVYLESNGAAKYQVQYGDNVSPAPPFSARVPAGQLFCLGDNRDNSYDSRYTGSVPFASVGGKKVP